MNAAQKSAGRGPSDKALPRVVLKPGREKALRRQHPWVFSGAIARLEGTAEPGDTVTVCSSDGAFLAYAGYSPQSQIRLRILGFDAAQVPDAALICARVEAAIDYRRAVMPQNIEACRLIHGEADGLPGVVVDRYGDTMVLQCTSALAERWREDLADALVSSGLSTSIYERSDVEVRRLEGLEPRADILRGIEPAAPLEIREGERRYAVDVRSGQKTGFYFDQRENRDLVQSLAAGCEVLDAFCYSGGFSIAALYGQARRVTAIDSAEEALARGRENVAANGFAEQALEWRAGDVFAELRALEKRGRKFDLIILDPPKFAPNERHVSRAARAYKDVNLWAFKLLRSGGLLATFSCSGAVSPALFQSIVAGSASDAGVKAVIVRRLGAAADHPIALNFPEGDYLKGLLVRAE